jgi:hypothetical protein
MSKSETESDWPFPSVSAYTVTLPGKGEVLTVSGSPGLIEAYLKQFGCVPVFTGSPRRRRLGRLTEKNEWTLTEPDGTSGLEAPIESIDDNREQLRILQDHNWYHVGYNANPELIEFGFGVDGEGFSRYSSWGYDTVVPHVEDFYWSYSISNELLILEWEDGSDSKISFSLKRQLRAASSLRNGSLTFYDMTLQVDSSLFPATASFAKYLLKEYWGRPKNSKEEE